MSIPKNILDDKDYKDFIEEAKAKLPSLSPEWTDYNISDTGIAILEIIGWIQDLNIYKLSQITDQHILKYLQFLGFTPKPVKPSSSFVVFKSNHKRIVKKDTDLKAVFSGKKINFKTTEDINIQVSEIKKIILNNERGINQFILGESSTIPEYLYIFGEESDRNNSFYLGFDKKLKGKFTVGFILYEDDLPEVGVHGEEEFRFEPDVELEWNYFSIDGWTNIKPVLDNTDKFHRSGTITFDLTGKPEMKKRKIPVNSEKDFYFIKCKLKKSGYEISPRVKEVFINAVKVIQKEKVKENLGQSNSFPNQIFNLSKKSLTKDSVKVHIDGEEWKEVNDLSHFSHKDKVFSVDRNNGKIIFGDNINGKVPLKNSLITAEYFISYGKDGNINKNVEWTSEFEDLEIYNPFLFTGGENPESLEQAFIRVKKDLKTPYQCVTAEDFEYIAVNTPDLRVAKVKAFTEENKNLVNIVVVPFSFKNKPIPSEKFLKEVCKHINKHRLLTTDIKVLPPEYVEISTSSSIKVKEDFNPDTVVENVKKRLREFFHPIFGWKDGKGWKFGHPVYLSDVYQTIETVEGVDCVFNLSISPKGSYKEKKNGNLILKPYTLTASGKHTVYLVKSEEECRS